MINQKTLILVKPDAMRRRVAGQIISRLELVGLRIVDCIYKQADHDLASKHYPVTDEWLTKVGGNSLSDCEKYGVDPMELLGTNEPKEVGKLIHQFNIDFLKSGPVLAIVFEGPHAVEIVRKLVGHTIPVLAAPGTIRGDFSSESAISAGTEKRTVENLIHASGSVEEAEREIELWFGAK